MVSVVFCDNIALPNTGLLRRGSAFHRHDLRRIISDESGNDHRKNERQNKVKHRSRGNNRNPAPHRGPVKGSGNILLRSIFSEHGAGTSDGKEFQGISGPPFDRTQ